MKRALALGLALACLGAGGTNILKEAQGYLDDGRKAFVRHDQLIKDYWAADWDRRSLIRNRGTNVPIADMGMTLLTIDLSKELAALNVAESNLLRLEVQAPGTLQALEVPVFDYGLRFTMTTSQVTGRPRPSAERVKHVNWWALYGTNLPQSEWTKTGMEKIKEDLKRRLP